MAATLVTFGASGTAARADEVGVDTLQGAYVGPIAPQSNCTADEKATWNGNTTYDPALPTDVTNEQNLPSIEDHVADRRAGAHTDYCVAFRMKPSLVPELTTDTRFGPAYRPLSAGAPANVLASNVAPVTVGGQEVPGTGDDLGSVVVDMPKGYLGNPKAVTQCTAAQFDAATPSTPTCPAGSQVGNAYSHLQLVFFDSLGPNPKANELKYDEGQIFNLVPQPGELGRLGVTVQPLDTVGAVKFMVRLQLVPDGSGRVRTITENIPNVIPLDWNADGSLVDWWRMRVESVGLHLWGSAADHPGMSADFSQNATSCTTPQQADIEAATAFGTRSHLTTAAHTLTGCDALGFRPTVEVSTTERRPGVPTGVDVHLRLGQNASGSETALLKDAAVTLPKGLELGAQAGTGPSGLPLCALGDFAVADTAKPSACAAATRVGSVRISSPLIAQPLTGTVALGEQSAVGTLPRLLVEASLDGATAASAPRIKLIGTVQASDDGRLVATFADNPQLRFDDLALSFPAGDHALFVTPRTCGVHSGTSTLSPWSGTAPVEVAASIEINQECDVPFAPTLGLSVDSPQAAASSTTTITIERPDRAAWMTSAAISLPPGFLADLNAASECRAAEAARGTCPDAARIGTVTTTAGAGAAPLSLSGAMYLTERQSGDVAGAVIVVRAKIGDLDLGDVVVPGRISLRPTDAGLDFRSDLPVRVRGVALHLRRVVVALDRSGFPLSPSACGPLAYASTITGDAGQTATPGGQISYTGCGALPFRPKLSATLTGDNTPGGHPGMYVRLDSPQGDTAIRSASVTLPQGVAASLPNVKNPCPLEDFNALRCAASTRVGSAVARVSITPDAIPGDIFLVRVPGKTLPGLGLSFTGRYAQRVISTVEVNKDGRLVTSFAAIPDLPLRSLTIQVDSSARSPLQLPAEGACTVGSDWSGAFVGQGGQTAAATTGLQCAAAANARLSDKRGLTVRLFDFGGRTLQSVKATLPTGWAFDARAAARKGAFWVRMAGSDAKVRLTARSITARATKPTATTVRMKISGGVVVPRSAAARKAKTVAMRLRLAFNDGTVQVQTLTVATR